MPLWHHCPTLVPIEFIEPDDGIDSRFRVHDENQVELKLHYAIDPAASKTRYQVEAYFFVPRTLGIDSQSYGRDAFFSDVQAYIRFKTPVHSLRDLGNDKVRGSPLSSVVEALTAGNRDALSRELRMLACLVRAASRDVAKRLEQRAERLAELPEEKAVLVDDLRRDIEGLDTAIECILRVFRALRPEFMHAQRPSWTSELFQYTDEAMSVFIEAHFTSLLKAIDGAPALRELLGESRERLVTRIVAEQHYRRAADYRTVVDNVRRDGGYVFRRGLLKKFISSVLFLELSKERDGQRLTELTAAIAAGAAMFVSTVLAIWSQGKYGFNTLPFVVAVVLGYMLKDRMKEWIKVYFSTKATRWLYDYSARITDPLSDVIVGRCRESFAFVAPGRTPEPVWRCRHADATSPIETENKRETVMRYVKIIELAGRRIDRMIARASDISDIVRFDVSRFLVRMDDAKQRVPVYDARNDRVRTVKMPKRYHLNVVLVLRAPDRGVVHMERFRFVLDKTGIKELHNPSGGAAVAVRAHDERAAAAFAEQGA